MDGLNFKLKCQTAMQNGAAGYFWIGKWQAKYVSGSDGYYQR